MVVLGKRQKYREIYLPPETKKALDEYLKERKAAEGINSVFVTHTGTPISYAGGRQILFHIAKKAGVHFSTHMARRFYVTELYKNGVDIEKIRQLVGHESISTTQAGYEIY